MKKSSCDAGNDLLDVHRTLMALSSVYSGLTPKISGRDSGRTEMEKLNDALLRLICNVIWEKCIDQVFLKVS